MHIPISRTSKQSISDQIAQTIMERIGSGMYKEGEPLHSVRQLAKEIGVSVVTVIKAYRILEQKGFTVTQHGKGTFITTSNQAGPSNATPDYAWQAEVVDYSGRSMFGQHTKRSGVAKYPFHAATLSEELLPMNALRQATERASHDPRSFAGYSSPLGDEDLRETLSSYFQSNGSDVRASEIMITTGCQQGIDLVARTFIGAGDVVLVESPTYPAALDSFRSRGARIVPIPSDHQGIRMDLLTRLFDEQAPKVVYVVPTGQNPTGSIMDMETRRRLLDLAESFHCLIVEDDPWSEIHYERQIPPSMYRLDQNGHVIFLKGFSKTLAPGLRLGCLAAKGDIYSRLAGVKAIADLSTPLFNQRSFLHLLRGISLPDYYDSVRIHMTRKRESVQRLLQKYAAGSVQWVAPQAGPNFWLQTTIDTDALVIEAERERISFLPGSNCFIDLSGSRYLRIGFGAIPSEKLEEGIAELCKLINNQEKTKETQR
ncbi:GntR family transcriptional regulator [Brevibacillus reuszeri]|uniref:GntR family transcriptional regulator n=1 Tax=Brevibacillus reuszeri TaxID=54915 RepID=A0A0K9YTJ2_9BACL|nr:PLP-dependent aminotransferase family protein [Brevibacillus reuszeri]KNB71515.1 hypothetical protein ADS79_22355 [Brevibacillus reuszeri]MED1855679.1 PLP-dependent aminotransferase family protein [Brevibacillus reuszeri]GED67171.1 GntR family transcriptional regulator [Brevibacillus reuszeri]